MSDASPGSFEEQATKAIKDLQNFQIRISNRQLAFEALLEAFLARTIPEALPGLLDEYEMALDRLATYLPPQHQQPDEWKLWRTWLENQIRLRGAKPPQSPLGQNA